MRILVFGAGVSSSVYAGKLRQAGHEVVLVARGRRLSDLRANGLVFEEAQSGQRTVLPVLSVSGAGADERYDLVLVPVRAEQLSSTLPGRRFRFFTYSAWKLQWDTMIEHVQSLVLYECHIRSVGHPGCVAVGDMRSRMRASAVGNKCQGFAEKRGPGGGSRRSDRGPFTKAAPGRRERMSLVRVDEFVDPGCGKPDDERASAPVERGEEPSAHAKAGQAHHRRACHWGLSQQRFGQPPEMGVGR